MTEVFSQVGMRQIQGVELIYAESKRIVNDEGCFFTGRDVADTQCCRNGAKSM